MLDFLILYALTVYWLFHLLSRSDLCAPARKWVARFAPQWLLYIGTCPFCFAFHCGWICGLIGLVPLGVVVLCAAPVVNMVLDLIVRALIRANEPPVMGEGKTIWEGNTGISTWRAPSVTVGGFYENLPSLKKPDTPFNPLDHEQTK